nr:hypothetical protein [Rhodoferax sp.]
MNDHQTISYALAKQVPDMARGFIINTSYGEIVIEAGWIADRMTEQMTLWLGNILQGIGPGARVEHGFSSDSEVIGGAWVQSGPSLTEADAQIVSDLLMAAQAPVQARLQALQDQIATLLLAVPRPSSEGPLPTCQALPDLAQLGDAPVLQTQRAALSEPSEGAAPHLPVAAPAPGLVHGHSLMSPKVEE